MNQEEYFRSKVATMKGAIETTFRNLDPVDGKVTGSNAYRHFLQSRLPKNALADIWELSDLDQDGFLTLSEFFYMSLLIEMHKDGHGLPQITPRPLLKCVQNALTPGISIETPNRYDNISQYFRQSNEQKQSADRSPLESVGSGPQGQMIHPTIPPLDHHLIKQTVNIVGPSDHTSIRKAAERESEKPRNLVYAALFKRLVGANAKLSGEQTKLIFTKTGLPKIVLAEIWEHSDLDLDGCLSESEFITAMSLIEKSMPAGTFNIQEFELTAQPVHGVSISQTINCPVSTKDTIGSSAIPTSSNFPPVPQSDITEKLKHVIASTTGDIMEKEETLKNLRQEAANISAKIRDLKFQTPSDGGNFSKRSSVTRASGAYNPNYGEIKSSIYDDHPPSLDTRIQFVDSVPSDVHQAQDLRQTPAQPQTSTKNLFDFGMPVKQSDRPSYDSTKPGFANRAGPSQTDINFADSGQFSKREPRSSHLYTEIDDNRSGLNEKPVCTKPDHNTPKKVSYSSNFSYLHNIDRGTLGESTTNCPPNISSQAATRSRAPSKVIDFNRYETNRSPSYVSRAENYTDPESINRAVVDASKSEFTYPRSSLMLEQSKYQERSYQDKHADLLDSGNSTAKHPKTKSSVRRIKKFLGFGPKNKNQEVQSDNFPSISSPEPSQRFPSGRLSCDQPPNITNITDEIQRMDVNEVICNFILYHPDSSRLESFGVNLDHTSDEITRPSYSFEYTKPDSTFGRVSTDSISHQRDDSATFTSLPKDSFTKSQWEAPVSSESEEEPENLEEPEDMEAIDPPLQVVALADFNSDSSGFSFKKGDEFVVCFKSNGNYYAEIGSDYDWFPCELVKPKDQETASPGFKNIYNVSSFRIATYANAAEDEDEISFEKNDLLVAEDDVYDGWIFGYSNGKKGIYPVNHTDIILNLKFLKTVDSIHEYKAQSTFELSIDPGQKIGILHRNSDNWMIGVKENSEKVGFFPGSICNLSVFCD
ncbi:Intersectin-1 [Thelohanellus kitauei]|uniref:Intersectin-1 n=1 Tax=Thelohanellus kitauei TaxID=669202 RepID=A0A0C2JSE3_THEKT|nr:Intersectin-1 [Thelohanellus kitauei]